MKKIWDMKDTDCRKCGAKMKDPGWRGMEVAGFLCECGHWNNLKRRKLNKRKAGEGE